MPPRWLCVVIILAWLGTTGPLLWKEFRPLFLARQPPPYYVDLLDEAQGERHPITWRVFVGDREPAEKIIGHTANSWVKYHPEDDTISFHTELSASRVRAEPLRFGPVNLRKMTSVERVDREELRLRDFEFEIGFDVEFFGVKIANASARGSGSVERGTLHGQFEMSVPGVPPIPLPVPEAQLPNNGAVLLPLHLVNRIRGLRPGQTWDQPMLDPVASLINAATGNYKAEVQNVEGRVLSQTEELPGYPDIVCHVIEYDSETKPRVFVQVKTDLVVRQESEYQGQRIVIQAVPT